MRAKCISTCRIRSETLIQHDSESWSDEYITHAEKRSVKQYRFLAPVISYLEKQWKKIVDDKMIQELVHDISY
jgi:hypothetical protein